MILSNLGRISVILAAALAFIMGGWTVLPLVVLAGALIGYGARDAGHSVGRAAISGAIGGAIVAAAAWFFNTILQQLPGQEAVPAESKQVFVYVGAVVLCAAVAGLVAMINSHPNENVRRFGMLGFLAACDCVSVL